MAHKELLTELTSKWNWYQLKISHELTWGQVMDPLLGKVAALRGWLLVEGQWASSSKVGRVKGAGGEEFKESMSEVARGKEKSRSSDKPTEFVSSDSDQF